MFVTQMSLSRLQLVTLMLILSLFYFGQAMANECLNLFPYDVKADGLPKICQARLADKTRLYSCQDYRSGPSHYRVLYRGGNTPQAVLSLRPDGKMTILASRTTQHLSCPLPAPSGIPRHAQHQGLGICTDPQDRPVACSIFTYAAARETQTHAYMVYYPRHAQEILRIEEETAGTNHDAMVAELAYQIGMRLTQSHCCHAQALAYLAYARSLFPQSEIYRHAYQRGRALLALRDL